MQLNSIAIDGTTVVTDKEAIIDTSGLFITGDSETITKIYSNIPNSARIPNSGTFQGTHVAGLLLEQLTDLRANDSPVRRGDPYNHRSRRVYVRTPRCFYRRSSQQSNQHCRR